MGCGGHRPYSRCKVVSQEPGRSHRCTQPFPSFMRPNTPHFVYTPTNTICYGGHFYATSTIRESCYGLMHSFIAQRVLSNASHEVESRELIRRMITYYHETLLQFGPEKSGRAFVTAGLSSFTAFDSPRRAYPGYWVDRRFYRLLNALQYGRALQCPVYAFIS